MQGPTSKQIGLAASAALPAIMQNGQGEEWNNVLIYNRKN